MTLLGGLFSRKNKGAKRDGQVSSVASSVADDWTVPSPTADYVTPDNHVPSVPNGKSYLHPDSARGSHTHLNGYHPSPSLEVMPSTSKLRIFGRKKSSIKPQDDAPSDSGHSFAPSSRPSFLSRTSLSDNDALDRRMRPPPSKSAIFAAYADPTSAHSTRSLPTDSYHGRSASPAPPTVPESPLPPISSPPPQTKRPSLFAWTKPSSKSIPSKKEQPRPTEANVNQVDQASFNLKSFRHVGPPTPLQANASNVSFHSPQPQPQPRPRADTAYSESQRISVAAFREAQARRSMAGSPVPSSGRSPSPLPPSNTQSLHPQPRRGASKSQSPGPPPPSYSAPPQQNRKSGMSLNATSLFTSDTDPDSSSEEAESDDEGTYTPARRGRQTNARPGVGSKAKSEMGHTTFKASNFRSGAKSQSGHDWNPPPSSHQRPQSQALLSNSGSTAEPMPRSQFSLGQNAGAGPWRPRASASTSALTPSAAAKRASVLAAANAANETDVINQYKLASRHIRDSSVHSNPGEPPSAKKAATNLGHGNFAAPNASSSDSESDSDNAPLATLVPPRRPGSAMSSYSNGSLRSTGNMPPKPLIDIKQLTGGSTLAKKGGAAPVSLSPTSPSKSMEGFTGGRTLLAIVDNPKGSQLNPKPPLQTSASPSTTPATSHAQSDVTTNVPPFKFASPPSTPGQGFNKMLDVPPRSSTMPSPSLSTSDPSGKENLSEGEKKRDALSERLSKVVKGKVGGGPGLIPPERSSTAPLPSPSRITPSPSAPIARERSQPPEPPSQHRATVFGSSIPKGQISSSPPVTRQRSNTTDMVTSASNATIRPREPYAKPSPPDPDLADLLGAAGMKLISRNGEDSGGESDSYSTETSESDSDGYGCDTVGKKGQVVHNSKGELGPAKEEVKIVPIPIKERRPAPSFSVTSRPQLPRGSPSRQHNALSVVSSTSGSSIAASAAGPSRPPPSPSPQPQGLVPTSMPNNRGRSSSTLTAMAPPSFLSAPSDKSNPAPEFLVSRNAPAMTQNHTSEDRMATSRSSLSSSALQPQPRQRSSTLLPNMSAPSPTQMPSRPFAARRDSPASSTGDSSSGRAPLTPRDGSDIGNNNVKFAKESGLSQYSGGASGLLTQAQMKKQMNKRRSVSFEDDAIAADGSEWRSNRMSIVSSSRTALTASGKEDGSPKKRSQELEMEERRKERRREEAKAAIELGEVVNGRGPILDDDDDPPMNHLNPRMPTMNSMMLSPMGMQPGVGFPGGPGAGWPMGMNPMMPNMGMPMASPQNMMSPAQFMSMMPTPPGANVADPNFLAAHQQAMMIAKQAYQVAVAQQAMAAAADEWERSSNMGYGSGSVYGGSTVGGYGMGMMGVNNWSTGSAIMPPSSSRSMYGGGGGMSSSRSDYGGGMSNARGGGWSSSKSSYGDLGGGPNRPVGGGRGRNLSAATAGNRDSVYSTNQATSPSVPPMQRSGGLKPTLRQRTTSQPALSGGVGVNGRKGLAPPSSWRNAEQ